MQTKITFAGANNTSFAQAEQDLRVLAEIAISDKQVRRICQKIGDERVAERDAAVATYQALPLTERKQVPEGVTAPAVAVVGVDGGRLQIFERSASVTLSEPEEIEDDTLVPEKPTPKQKHWREDKIGVLLTLKSEEKASDPCPEIPDHFVDPSWIPELAKELNHRHSAKCEAKEPAATPAATTEVAPAAVAAASTEAEEVPWTPEVLTKDLVATRRPWDAFGPMVATAAWAAGFFGAERRAFVGDGAENNWTLWQRYFSSFVPILDFIHALSYVFASATAGRPSAEGWTIYQRWIGWVWRGDIESVIAELAARQAELGVPEQGESATSPRKVVAAALGYLQRNKERMRYAEYRRLGLPIVSSYVESAVKQFNYRVKGTEKFWRERGAEPILQLRGDSLSDSNPLPAFWQRRQARESGQPRYNLAA